MQLISWLRLGPLHQSDERQTDALGLVCDEQWPLSLSLSFLSPSFIFRTPGFLSSFHRCAIAPQLTAHLLESLLENSFLRIILSKPKHHGFRGSEHTEVKERQDEREVGARGFYMLIYSIATNFKNCHFLNPDRFWNSCDLLAYQVENTSRFSPNCNYDTSNFLFCLTGFVLSLPLNHWWSCHDGQRNIPESLWRMNFPNHWFVLEGEAAEDQTISPAVKSPGLFSVQGFCFRRRNQSGLVEELFFWGGFFAQTVQYTFGTT